MDATRAPRKRLLQPPACPAPRRVDQRHFLRQRWRRRSTASDRAHGIAEMASLMHLHSSATFWKCQRGRAHAAPHGATSLTPLPLPWVWGRPPCSYSAPSTLLTASHGSHSSFVLARSLAWCPILANSARADAVAARSTPFAAPDGPQDMSGHECAPKAGRLSHYVFNTTGGPYGTLLMGPMGPTGPERIPFLKRIFLKGHFPPFILF